jgi:hypothetical protein
MRMLRIDALFRLLVLLGLTFWLAACASVPASRQTPDQLPGGAQFYSYGVSQSKENFANIQRAQSEYTPFTIQRTRGDDKAVRAPATINMLQAYYPLRVRREFKR